MITFLKLQILLHLINKSEIKKEVYHKMMKIYKNNKNCNKIETNFPQFLKKI
jgi:hypothetical protein